jgi:hypothetical protein
MFRNDLLKLSVTLVLLVATAFVSVTAVAADPWYPVKAGDAAVASDWYARHSDTGILVNAADLSDYFQRNPSSIRSTQYFRLVAVNAVDLSDYFQRHPDTGISASAADLSDYFQRQSSIFSGDVAGSLMYYGPPGR